jgi:hypothetical protein
LQPAFCVIGMKEQPSRTDLAPYPELSSVH